jgi:hypothetical protein
MTQIIKFLKLGKSKPFKKGDGEESGGIASWISREERGKMEYARRNSGNEMFGKVYRQYPL